MFFEFLVVTIFAMLTTFCVKRLGKYSNSYFSIASLVDQSDELISKKFGVFLLFGPSTIVFSTIYFFTGNSGYAYIYLLLTLCFTFYPTIVYPEALLEYKYYKNKNLVFLLFLLYCFIEFTLCHFILEVINMFGIGQVSLYIDHFFEFYDNIPSAALDLIILPILDYLRRKIIKIIK